MPYTAQYEQLVIPGLAIPKSLSHQAQVSLTDQDVLTMNLENKTLVITTGDSKLVISPDSIQLTANLITLN